MASGTREGREITDALIGSVVETRPDDLGEATIRQAKRRIIDIVGCMIGGSAASGSQELRDLVLSRGGREQSSIVLARQRVPTAAAAFVNAVQARGNDFGVLIPYIGDRPVWSHISESTVPAALAVAEATKVSGAELIAALVVGDDLTTRLAAGSNYVPGAGWDSPGIVNKFGVAAIAGRLTGLGRRSVQDAFGIVLNQLGGTFQAIDDGAHTFKLAQGLAARDGVEAAELAAHGWTGSDDPLFGRNGYADMYCQGVDLEVIGRDLGTVFHGDMTFKPYPACRFTHSTIDCALQLRPQLPEDHESIASITVDVAPMHIGSPLAQDFAPGRYPQGHAIFSLRYAAASVLVRGGAGLDAYVDSAINSPEVAAMAARASVVGGRSPATPEAATVTVVLKDGRVLTASTDTATGNPLVSPMDDAGIEAKFRENCAHAGLADTELGEALLAQLWRLEDLPGIAGITEHLRQLRGPCST